MTYKASLPKLLHPYEDIFNRFLAIRRGGYGEKNNTLHKPLLLIWTISKCIQDGIKKNAEDERLQPYNFYKEEFGPKIKKYILSNTQFRIYYPYWRLSNDDVWDYIDPINETWNNDPPMDILKQSLAGLKEPDYHLIRNNPTLGCEIIIELLKKFIPDEFHVDILLDAKVPLTNLKEIEDEPFGQIQIYKRRLRSYKFRQTVLPVYQYMCAVCQLSIQLYSQNLALEAAHIKAVKDNGPDKITNGLSLCSNHHALFDSGAFTIAPYSKRFLIEISDKTNVKGKDKWLIPYDKQQLITPKHHNHKPKLEYIEWHREHVFAVK